MAGNSNSGRRPKSMRKRDTELTLADTAPRAAQLLQDTIDDKIRPSAVKIDVAKYIINQTLGMPKTKTELSGNLGVSWGSLLNEMEDKEEGFIPEAETGQITS